MISPFKALQLIYSAKLVEVIVQYQIRGRDVPYKIIVAAVCVWVTVLFPLFLCVYLYVVFLKVTSVKDAEEWLEERVKLHTLYMCTSEYEWRNAAELFSRSLKYAQDIAEQKGGNFSLYSYTSLEGVCATLCSKGGSLFEIRLESKDEYTGRIIQCSETKRASDARNSEPARMSDEQRAIYTREFGQQYDLIVMHAQGDLFKSLYLGLTVMATKKPIGSKSKPLDALIFGGLSK